MTILICKIRNNFAYLIEILVNVIGKLGFNGVITPKTDSTTIDIVNTHLSFELYSSWETFVSETRVILILKALYNNHFMYFKCSFTPFYFKSRLEHFLV